MFFLICEGAKNGKNGVVESKRMVTRDWKDRLGVWGSGTVFENGMTKPKHNR